LIDLFANIYENCTSVRVKTITVPTYITLTRFVLIPVFVNLFLAGRYKESLIIFAIAGITDFFDGYLARTLNQRSQLGSMLDPLADKFLMLFSYGMLSSRDYLPDYVSIIVIGRDLMILTGIAFLWLIRIKLYYKPTILSKICTTFQMLLLCHTFLYVYLTHRNFEVLPYLRDIYIYPFKEIFYLIVIAMTFVTSCQYTYMFYKFFRYGERRAKS